MKFFRRVSLALMTLILISACGGSGGGNSSPSVETDLSLSSLSTLDNTLRESSGLIKLNGKVYTHNDSGNAALLYEINVSTGAILRTITINNAANVDWEDLAYDDTYLYIADTGNNLGDRTDLTIYKVLRSDIDGSASAHAEVISFSYADQIQFGYAPFTSPYDAEALIVYGGELYLFTKNWEDYKSKVYKIPTTAGTYSVSSVSQMSLEVMVTGATINEIGDSISLVGYTNPQDSSVPFKSMIISLSNYASDDFFAGVVNQENIVNGSTVGQLEAIMYNTTSQLYLSAEGVTINSVDYPAILYKIELLP